MANRIQHASKLVLRGAARVGRCRNPGRMNVFGGAVLLPKSARPMSTMPRLVDDNSAMEHHENEKPLLLSPYVVHSPQFKFRNTTTKPVTWDDFLEQIPAALQKRQKVVSRNPDAFQFCEDPVTKLFRSIRFERDDWEPFAHFDTSSDYSRNLIATDDKTYTLMLLCWNPGRESKIHDHPCDGCWMTILQGQIQECRYEYPKSQVGNTGNSVSDTLHCFADDIFVQGQVTFINDSVGLHKVSNPSASVPAVSLHLYSPPFDECRVWVRDDPRDQVAVPDSNATRTVSAKPKSCYSTYFSEYGEICISS